MDLKTYVDFDNTEVAFSSKSNRKLFKARLLFWVVNHPFLAAISTGLVRVAIFFGLPVNWIIKPTVFEHFCGGETIKESEGSIAELASFNIKTILDYSVEGEDSEEDFETTKRETLRTIKKAAQNSNMAFCVFKPTGLASQIIMEKVQLRKNLTDEEGRNWQKAAERFDAICNAASEMKIPILIDAEDSWIQDPIDKLAMDLMRKYNRETAIVFNTYQLYKKNALQDLKRDCERARTEKFFLGAKLVRGAYMEKERERAEEKGYPDPINESKEDTDRDYNAALEFCIENIGQLYLFSGSHNEYSNYYLTLLMEKQGLAKNDKRIFFGQLYGMGDHISFNLAAAGYNVAKYVPFGPVKSVMPYLFRRAEENTSVKGQSSRELTLIRKETLRRKSG